jgi:hypothetical protein
MIHGCGLEVARVHGRGRLRRYRVLAYLQIPFGKVYCRLLRWSR